MAYQYRPEILDQLLVHGIRPTPRTRPALVFGYVGDLYRYELRRLRRLRAEGTIPAREYGNLVAAMRRTYPLVSVPVRYWTVPGTPADPEDVPLC